LVADITVLTMYGHTNVKNSFHLHW